MPMSNAARIAFSAYTTALTGLSGLTAEAATQGFTVEPTIEQKLEKKVQQSSAFLSKINIIGVDQLKGEKLGLGSAGPMSGRTNTAAGNRRKTKDGTTLDAQGYECVKIDCDTHVRYSKLDAWAKFPEFNGMMRDVVIEQKALDRIMTGFNGTHAAVETNLETYPLLQDNAVGWLQHVRNEKEEHVMSEGEKAGVIRVGFYPDAEGTPGVKGDFANLDAVVQAALQLLPERFRGDQNIVCIVGYNLMHDKNFPMIDVRQAPTEQIAAGVIMAEKKLGGKSVEEAPYFPPNSILITRLDNLSIYYQNGGRRERVVDQPDLDQVATFTSSNDAYVVEDYEQIVLIENISTDPTEWPAP